MNNLDKMSFNYQKNVNNLSNQGGTTNKIKSLTHKMNHTGAERLYVDFYDNYKDFSIDFANFEYAQFSYDLEMYLHWLGRDGIK